MHRRLRSLSFLLGCGATLLADSGRLVPIEGEPRAAQLVQLNGRRAEFREVAGRTRRWSADEVVRWGNPTPAKPDFLVLTDGSIVPGHVATIMTDHVSLESRVWGTVKVPRKLVRSLVWQLPSTTREHWRYRDAWLKPNEGRQTLQFVNGDNLGGQLVDADSGSVRWEGDEQRISIPEEKLFAWRNQHRGTPTAPIAHTLGLRDGSLLVTTKVSLEEQLQVTLACGLSLTSLAGIHPVEEQLVVYWRPRGERIQYLSNMTPIGQKHIPFLGEVRWPAQFDRNVLGGSLRCDGRLFAKGIGMHSTAQIAYDLQPEHVQFQAEVGLDDSAGTAGSVVVRVLTTLNGTRWQTAYQSDVLRGDATLLRVRVYVGNSRRMALVVDYADGGDVLDRTNWIGARLVRGRTAP